MRYIIPQIITLMLFAYAMHDAIKHKPYSWKYSVASTLILFSLLLWGGFYDNI